MPTRSEPLSRGRVERVIAAARVALAGSSLLGIWLDPAEPSRLVDLTYTLQAVYLFYALALAGVMWRRESVGRLPLVTHLTDIAVASIFQYLTLGPSSPFFTYFVFALFSAAIRWGWQATVRTAGLVLGMFIAISVWLSRTLGPAEFELNRFVIRAVYLIVVTIVLVYLGQHEARLRDEIRRIARWPAAGPGTWTSVVPKILEHALSIIRARQVMVIWRDADAGGWHMSTLPESAGIIETFEPATFQALVPPNLTDSSFLCRAALDGDAVVDVSRAGAVTRWTGLPVNPSLVSRLGSAGLMSAPFSTDQVSGRVFFTEMSSPTVEALPLVELVAREIGGSISQLHSYDKSRQIAITEDRIRVARDLHDGVLQSLTGIRLELQSMADQAAGSWRKPPSDRLLAIERALSIEQRELRRFIEDLRPTSAAPAGPSLAGRLEDLRQRIALEWRTPITIRVSPSDLALPDAIDRDVPLMVHEAIVNALKHGRPSRVAIDVRLADDDLTIIVKDDGRGFGFRGRRDHGELVASNAGPVSLRERVASLGGEIAVESGPSGSRVELTLPMRFAHV